MFLLKNIQTIKIKYLSILLVLSILFISCAKRTSQDMVIQSGAQKSSVMIGFSGDSMMGRKFQTHLSENFDPFYEVGGFIREHDFFVANMECVVADDGEKQDWKMYCLMTPPEELAYFTNAGVNIVSLANNHAIDYQADGLIQTMSNLDKYDILYTGAGTNYKQAAQPVIVSNSGISAGILCFGEIDDVRTVYADDGEPGIASLDSNQMVSAVSNLRHEVDYLAVCLHMGWEYHDEPTRLQQYYSYGILEAGADVVIIHGVHVIQGIEIYKGKPIFHNLGNFIFDQVAANTLPSMLVSVEIQKEIAEDLTNISAEYFITPLMKNSTNYSPEYPDSVDLTLVTNRLLTLSSELNNTNIQFILNRETHFTNFRLEY